MALSHQMNNAWICIWEFGTWHTRQCQQCPTIRRCEIRTLRVALSVSCHCQALSGIAFWHCTIWYNIVATLKNLGLRKGRPSLYLFASRTSRDNVSATPFSMRPAFHLFSSTPISWNSATKHFFVSVSVPCSQSSSLVVHDVVPRLDRDGDYHTRIAEPFVLRGKRAKGLRMQAYID